MPFDVSSIFAQQVQAVSKSDTGRELMQVDVDDLVSNEANFYAVDEAKLEELKNSIALSGIMDPPTVTRTEEGNYRLISGHRRTAAVRALVAEGREDLRKVPVFVRSPKSAAMEELELIMANSTARVLTSAEISQAAQRVERLLYDLKEQGVEFPGRMRDHVAEACNVSKTKLANLHMIEENLISGFKQQWALGKLPDVTALELARCEPDLQMRLLDAFARTKEFPTSAGIVQVRELAEKGAVWHPSNHLHCPDGKWCPNSRDDATLRHDATCGSWTPQCKGEMCCMDCKYGAKARGCYDVCDQMCSKAKQYRTDKNAAEKQKEETEKENKQRVFQAAAQQYAQRIVRAIDAAGLADGTTLIINDTVGMKTAADIRNFAEGEFGAKSLWNNEFLLPSSRAIPTLCAELHCSADYLLGLTDELQPVPKSDTAALPEGAFRMAWRTDTDYPDGPVLLLVREDGVLSYETDDVEDGKFFWFDAPDDGEILRWLPLPPEEEGSI